jgi:hypothetical protein
MKENSSTSRICEGSDDLRIAYSISDRVEPALLLCVYAAMLATGHYIWHRSDGSPFSDHSWFLMPMCLLGDAGLIAFFLWTGSIKSPVSINMDGTVRQGVAVWKFPGPMTALVAKTGGGKAPPRYWIDLRYGPAAVRLTGDTTEGQTIGTAAQINRWSRLRIQGISDPFDSRNATQPISWGVYLIALLIAVFFINVAFGNNGTYLNLQAQPGAWAKASAVIFTLLVAGATGMRWKAFANAGIRRGAVVVLAEVAIAALFVLASGAIGGHSAQVLETAFMPGTVVTFDAPLNLTRTTQGKGCHRYLWFEDPSLGRVIRYCDPHSLEYWSKATRVEVTEARNDLGIRILSVNSARTEPSDSSPATIHSLKN